VGQDDHRLPPSTSGSSSAPASSRADVEAQWRPCRLEAGPLKDVAEWAEPYRRFWDASYERLDEYLQRLQDEEEHHDHGT
jgi:hypothetical protein